MVRRDGCVGDKGGEVGMHIRLARAEAHFERGRRLHTCLARLALEHLPLGLVVYCGLQRSVPL